MDEYPFLKGQRVLTPRGEGEVVDAIGKAIVVVLDNSATEAFPFVELEDHSNGGLKAYMVNKL